MATVTLLMGVLLPVVSKVRRQARDLRSMSNQRQVAGSVGLYAADNDEKYPPSIATLGPLWRWNWADPRMMIGRTPWPRRHSSISEYLRGYIQDVSVLHCANAPGMYKYLQASWDAGDNWNNPETPMARDYVYGTYCFYWNYTGFLGWPSYLFKGPEDTAGGRGQSKLLVSCYFGYNHHRSKGAYGSCQKFKGVRITPATWSSSPYWSRDKKAGLPDVKLYAAYTDGHVESYSASDTVQMRVIVGPADNTPYPLNLSGPGIYYIPKKAIRR